MRVEPSQLVPGCVLLNDVTGKSNKAIIPKKTTITEQHITILEKFFITYVDVGSKLSDGKVYSPSIVQKKKEPVKKQQQTKDVSQLSFGEHYQYVVENYKKLFTAWQNNIAVDMPAVRKLIIPLFERMDQDDVNVFTLHMYSNKNDYMYHHSVAVSILAAFLGKKLGYSNGDYTQIGLAGFLSDCGMAKITPSIINKTTYLYEQEVSQMKNHPTYSYRMVEHVPTITQLVKLAILQHHERMDGRGYPLGVQKDKIHAYSRIIAVCDMYHAATCERVYQSKQSPFQAMEDIARSKYNHFDHQVAETFIKSLANFAVGTKVKLSNGDVGEIVFAEDNFPTRPMVKVTKSEEIVTLKNNPDIYIEELL
ncbi:HD-GYP domain-containing protein [Virgibacillus flavescens]|uniref:HD-GYP domain-containing protein n=1 Tax=Virgibacillus flavescens TaxID=1611422 RepID=UPI003D3399BA